MMEDVILKIENLGKQYRLGLVGTGTLSHDLNRWWHKVRGKDDPYLKVGAVNDRSAKATTNYVWALKDINIEVKRGEVLGIIGKNGAGKSTLLKILSRVTGPTEGTIKSNGRIASLLEVGTGFHPELTGRENIYLNGAILGMTKSEIKAKEEEIIEFSGCAMYIDTPVKRYSSGMRVRLAFAVAAHLEPDILVIDEVLAVGDAEFQKKAVGKMQDISSSEGRTVLFVSHNMSAVKSLCTRAVVLEHGKIVFEGNQYEAVDHYISVQKGVSNQNLEERTDRQGSQKLKLTGIKFFNDKGEEVIETTSGNYLRIRLFVKKYKPVNYDKLFVALNIVGKNQEFVLSFVNDEMGISFKALEDRDYFDLVIPKLYLRSRIYNMRVLITENDTQPENFVDLIENVAQLHVFAGDLWNSGKLNRRGYYGIIPGSFQFDID